MSIGRLLKKITELTPPAVGEAVIPDPAVVGFYVRWARELRHWKKGALAAVADVSLSTVERVERGERVAKESLEGIARAFGYPVDTFTSPRPVMPPDKAEANLRKYFSELESVKVAPLRTQAQLRALANCHSYLPYLVDVPEDVRPSVANLLEWLDVAAFVLTESGQSRTADHVPRRQLYASILECVAGIGRLGYVVSAGVMNAPQPGFPEWKIALVCISSRRTDPAAAKRRAVMVDRRSAELANHSFDDISELALS